MPRIDLRIDPHYLENAARDGLKGGAGYPPFDVCWFPDEPDGVFLRITLAVAGFAEDELDVVAENSVLFVSGLQEERAEGEFLYRGIAGRQFRRQFTLADGMDVVGASLERGLLEIDIARRPKEVRKINISVSD
ncbi:Hsp20 family protein [Martelella endophytica]|uniref:Heat-shock protein Hsp20 n=1 Tax=Martelella endophytica TaxID=1486262 RepID=A0A0D5LTR1_MAREN|nr:Hsp20 family protein [Martelella endophytica]AJY47350.1 heat-shock protein Hsp20 [Martelella endophytica]